LVLTISPQEVGRLAELYDRFTYSLDPYCRESDEAEKAFGELVAGFYDELLYQEKQAHVAKGGNAALFTPSISFQGFRREVISRCKQYLKANRQP
jgi:hypothetical protein